MNVNKSLIGFLFFTFIFTFYSNNLSAKEHIAFAQNKDIDFKCFIPKTIESSEELFFYFKCQAKNISNKKIKILKRARTFASFDNKTHKCLRYDATYYQNLNPGKSAQWWQHALAPKTGELALKIKLEAQEGLITNTVKTKIIKANISSENKTDREKILQRNWTKFQKVSVNNNKNLGSFKKNNFTNDPLRIGGILYQGVVFEAPDSRRKFFWAFKNTKNKGHFFITPIKGATIPDLNPPYSLKLKKDYKNIAKKDEIIFLSYLSKKTFIPGQKYIFWYSSKIGTEDDLTFSFNFTKKDSIYINDVFKEIFSLR